MTIKEIANLSGVSITTVSRVINQKRVGEANRKKVLEIIARCNFQPNPYAQYLGHRRNGRA